MTDDELVARLTEAVLTVTRGLELEAVLQNVVEAAATLLDARYAALGVLGQGEELQQFVHTGFDGDLETVGNLPTGKGILGLLIRDPKPLRLRDLTTHEQSYGFPEGHPEMRSFVGVPIRVRDRVYGNLYVTEKRGGEFTASDERLAEALAATAGAAIDNAFSYQATRARERSLDAVREVTGAILSGHTDDRVLELIADRARELVDADLAAICVPMPQQHDDTLYVLAAAGKGARAVTGSVVPAADALSRKVMLSGQLVATDRLPPELAPPGEHGQQRMAIGVPLAVRGDTFGALALSASRFDSDHLRLIELFANQASVTLDYTDAREEVERLMLIEERERIGRDLHDTVIQRLFATGLELQAIAARTTSETPEIAERLGDAVDNLDETILQIRTTIFALQPSGLGSSRDVVSAGRLYEQVAGVVAESARALGFEPSIAVPGDPEHMIPVDVAEHVLVVVREGLSNVARHADATEASVVVEVGDDVVARVMDNGVGITPVRRPGGYGLENMRERADALGGHFEVGNRREGGTVLEWRVRAVPE